MKPGCCVNIPAGVKHWHGAAPDSWFSHLAIEVPGKDGTNEWLEPVTDGQYGILKQPVKLILYLCKELDNFQSYGEAEKQQKI